MSIRAGETPSVRISASLSIVATTVMALLEAIMFTEALAPVRDASVYGARATYMMTPPTQLIDK